jgi:chaperonin cofactor prefoldin
MVNVILLNDVYKSYVNLRNTLVSGESVTDSLQDLESTIHKREESLNQQIQMLKTEIERLSSL